MRRATVVLALVLAGGWMGLGRAAEKEKEKGMLAHDVYFTLIDASAAGKQQLVDGCKKYLSDHPGTVCFAVGIRGPEFQRDVNIQDYDVALHLVFQDKAAHDRYQTADRHNQFIKLCKSNWKQVRVFDSYLEASSHDK